MDRSMRIVRLPLPVDLIRNMDRLILTGVGGYQSRAEFIKDAIDSQIVELTYEFASDEPRQFEAEDVSPALRVPKVESSFPTQEEAPDLGITTLTSPPDGPVLDRGVDVVEKEPLFGLHNRDYPSLWAARQLAEHTRGGPVRADDFYAAVIGQAWEFGTVLASLEHAHGSKMTALFPTNAKKRQAAENIFRAFALGTYGVTGGRTLTVGPLYQWRLARLAETTDGLVIGLTTYGRALLAALAGINVSQPHDPSFTREFLRHLRIHAPDDWWGFSTISSVLEGGASRSDVVERFLELRQDWSDTQASTNAAGYVARAREWGLVEMKQVRGQYRLTPDGGRMIEELRGVHND